MSVGTLIQLQARYHIAHGRDDVYWTVHADSDAQAEHAKKLMGKNPSNLVEPVKTASGVYVARTRFFRQNLCLHLELLSEDVTKSEGAYYLPPLFYYPVLIEACPGRTFPFEIRTHQVSLRFRGELPKFSTLYPEPCDWNKKERIVRLSDQSELEGMVMPVPDKIEFLVN